MLHRQPEDVRRFLRTQTLGPSRQSDNIDNPKREPLLQRILSPFSGRFWLWIYPREPILADSLGVISRTSVEQWLGSGDREWAAWAERLAFADPPLMSGAVNPGERRALFALIKALQPRRILEIGTHIGGSTVVIAAALESNGAGELRTVDILDVNQADRTPWATCGSMAPPADLLAAVGLSHRVSFTQATSVDYLARSRESFDLIFLDGNHNPEVVYPEITRGTHRLNAGGYILLHDYFPQAKPVGAVQNFMSGPFYAAERVCREAPSVKVISLNPLPWPAANESHATTLAIVGRH